MTIAESSALRARAPWKFNSQDGLLAAAGVSAAFGPMSAEAATTTAQTGHASHNPNAAARPVEGDIRCACSISAVVSQPLILRLTASSNT